jgi:ketosteroid isomerase-like protein
MKKSTQFSFLFAAFAAVLFLTAACKQTSQEQAKPDLAQIRSEIQALENAYAAGLNANNADAVVVYYADDAVSMVNNAPIAVGHDALLKMVQDEIAADTTQNVVAFETVDIYAAGDLVVETGKATYTDPAGKVVKAGKYMSVFEKRDGRYVCIRDIYNDDQK